MSNRRSFGPLIFGVLVLAAGLGLAFWGISTRAKSLDVVTRETRELAVPTVSVIAPERGSPQQEIVLPGTMQAFTDAGIFALKDADEQWIALRYDLTAPLSRYVAQNIQSLPLPFRRYQVGQVYRNEKPGPGRFREFTQFDVDTVGCGSFGRPSLACCRSCTLPLRFCTTVAVTSQAQT